MDYKKQDVWIQARGLVKEIYLITKGFPREEQFGITAQMRRCAISVSSNIAEGCGRQTSKDTINFLHIARGSLYELETQIILAADLGFFDINENDILNEVERVKKLLHGFINYYRKL